MRKRLSAVLAAIALALGLGLIAAQPAAAGNCTTVAGKVLCGRVTVTTTSVKGVSITNGWAPIGSVWSLTPGQTSQRYIRDTDGFRVPSGCWGHYDGTGVSYAGGVWHKIGDGSHIVLRVECPR